MELQGAHTRDGGLRKKGIRRGSSPEKPLVSIVTVVLNGEKHLDQTIESVVKQTYPNIEYIIIDGGSRDRSLEIIRKNETNIDYWTSAPDKGIYDAMNKGVRLCQGVLINLLNADDYLSPFAVEAVVAEYVKQRKPCIIYGDYHLIDESLGYQVDISSHMNYWLGMTVSHQSMFVHRNIYATLGSYDTTYSLAADYDFLLRTTQKGVPFIHTGVSLVFRRLHGRGGKNFLRSMRETNAINRAYFRGSFRYRIAYWLKAACDAGKLLVISTSKTLLGTVRTGHFLLSYYKARSVQVSRLDAGI